MTERYAAEGQRLLAEAFALSPGDDSSFFGLFRKIRAFQRRNCGFYDRFCRSAALDEPWLPVESFGLSDVSTFPPAKAEAVFVSSGTTSSTRSRHYVYALADYRRAVVGSYRTHLADNRRSILAHLPGYAESGQASSLVFMCQTLIDDFGTDNSAFFLDDTAALRTAAQGSASRNPILLIGAAFGLLDLIEAHEVPRLGPHDRVVETGGMKTYRREITREKLHSRLAAAFDVGVNQILSEYGMCELMSQFYRLDDRGFRGPPWVRYRIVDPSDPSKLVDSGEEGRLAIIDLANVFTVSGLLTGDRAVERDSGFEVLGRISPEHLRGCNFLFEAASSATEGPIGR